MYPVTFSTSVFYLLWHTAHLGLRMKALFMYIKSGITEISSGSSVVCVKRNSWILNYHSAYRAAGGFNKCKDFEFAYLNGTVSRDITKYKKILNLK